ncbi:winged helix-turn-helix transcriptional regulator [Rhodococcus sp. NPDC019627]|uniref:winged helix-turn-helix transcriptional regulator n=1 Tax=unclassified Rhodococcus (in: high G+C Gram-positive bacteria) TaxID=192944 RepID=UPI0034008B4C
MSGRTYGQNCGLARALDLLGERWTLLIMRDLGMGPRRYKDLASGLPGIGTNLLASRLKSLEEAGMIERVVLPPPASVAAYALTSAGEELRPVLAQLAAWGLRHGAGFDDADMTRAEWVIQGMFARADADAASRFGGVVQFDVGDESSWIGPSANGVVLRPGVPPTTPKVHVAADITTLVDLANNVITLDDALKSGALVVEASDEDMDEFLRVYPLGGVGASTS